jgi:hypothetical protein
MAQRKEHTRGGVESAYAKLLLAVLPLFMSNLPCYNQVPQAYYNTTQEHELKNLRSFIHFEIRLVHVTLTRAQAALADAAFEGCTDVLKSFLDMLESLLRVDTVTYLACILGSRTLGTAARADPLPSKKVSVVV